jgi:pyruvate ferredoxin oxidoreductase gamma subunit
MNPGVTRIRFHGRGGQGMKTASRIVGTATAMDGHNAQDSPVYGAERRGAPMSAYVRIADGPIFERGFIPSPDIVVVADDTLLDDPTARPLAGLRPTGVLLISTTHPVDAVRSRTRHAGAIVATDFLSLALSAGAGPISVSTALAAAVAHVLGLPERTVAEAIRTELGAAHVSAAGIDRSVELAARVREAAPVVSLPVASVDRPIVPGVKLTEVTYLSPEAGTASIGVEANTTRRRTGTWRVFRPVIDLARCTRCWICFVRCPDGAIALDADDTPRIDDDVCKGCLICVEECPTGAITSTREVRPWHDAELVT